MTNRIKSAAKATCCSVLGSIYLLVGATYGPVRADDYGYMVAGDASGVNPMQFGVVDLTTGAFSVCGQTEFAVSGLGVGTDGNLYGSGWGTNLLYKIDLHNGHLTQVGTSNIIFDGIGSARNAPAGLYAVASAGGKEKLYSVDQQTAAATELGPLGVDLSGYWTLSESSHLFLEDEHSLYRVPRNGKRARLVGVGAQGRFLGLTTIRGTMYGISSAPSGGPPSAVYSIDRTNGAVSKISDVTGTASSDIPLGLVGIKKRVISVRRICQPHELYN